LNQLFCIQKYNSFYLFLFLNKDTIMTETIVIRFTKKDKEYLSKLATKHRLTLSSFLRSELLNSLTSKSKLDV